MSSPISPPFASCQDTLLEVVADVAENSLFSFADISDAAAFAAAAEAEPGADWVQSVVAFAGPEQGQLTLTMPASLTGRLCAAFAGAETSDDTNERDLVDFAGELANMVCGRWLTRVHPLDAFVLTAPRVHRGRADACLERTEPKALTSETVYLAIDDTPVRLDIDWTAPAAAPAGHDAR